MNYQLSIRALQLYGSKFGVPWYSPTYLSYSFIPMFRRMGYVWIHISSVVRYCHIAKPDEFGYLNRHNIFEIAGPHQMINDGRETRSFRLLKIDDFQRITGIKI